MKHAISMPSAPGPFPDLGHLGGSGAPGVAHCLAALLDGDGDGALRRAHGLLSEVTLLDLAGQPAHELVEQFALGLAEAVRVEAGLRLGLHVRVARQPMRPAMGSAQRVYKHLGLRLAALERETLQALLLDGKHRLKRVETISVGTLTSSLVHPREVFRAAIRNAAAALILVHNHPSGDPEPSLEDIKVTRRLLEVSRTLGIPLLDHIIIARGSHVSLRERLSLTWP